MKEEMKPTIIVSEAYTRAVSLTRSIIASAMAAQQSLYEVCKGLKEVRDNELFKELGYQNFENYCENEVKITYRQAKKYVAIAAGFEGSQLPSIGTEKLYLLAKLDEPTRQEITEAVDVEHTTVRELKAQITALTAERDTAKASLASKDKQFREALEGKDKQLKAAQDAKETAVSECKTFLNGKIHELEARIQELQDQPITHDMTDADAADEIMRLKRELEDERLKYTILEGGAEAKARRAADAVRQEYEKKLAEFQTAERSAAPDTKDVFKAYLANAADALTRLLTYLESIRDDKNLPLYISKVDGIVEMTQTRRNAL
jgi:hypothetical protein